ncbi:DUF7528 family protein [Halolamina rubra]|uniref:DUF7528 family protein n=1 Tax=Halolamina rubra TaxID=1380430 RepID=UPI000678A3A0|nr:hypothetical protein [Halolamina rubra]
MTVERDGETVTLRVDGETQRLSREQALALRAAVGDALERRVELFRTVGRHRRDGSYAVSRRGADTPGNEQVFDSFGALRALFASLPTEFGAEAVGDEGVTGSRRHLLVRHLAEHPAFDCRLVSERPLRAEKNPD